MNYMEVFSMIRNYNYHKQFDKSKLLYEKYYYLIPKYDVYLQNKFLNEYEIACKKFVLKSKPRTLQIVLFDKCVFNCIMCTQKDKKYNYLLPERYMEETFHLLPYVDSVIWQGGEVFLWDNFIPVLNLTSRYKRITQSIITNFQTITKNQIKSLSQINNLKLIISIDGSTKKLYEDIRCGSSFDRLIDNINLLNKYRLKYKTDISLHINFVVMHENYNDILNIISFAKKYMFESVSYIKCRETKNYNNRITDYDKICIDRLLNFATIKSVKDNIQVNVEYLSSILKNKNKIKNIKTDTLVCKLPFYKLLLAEDFGFAPECSCFKRFDYNNKNISMKQMWNSNLMQKYRKHVLETEDNSSICNSNCLYYASQHNIYGGLV